MKKTVHCRAILLGMLSLALFSACTTNVSAPLQLPINTSTTYVYECPDGTNFTANIKGEKAWLFLPGKTLSLAHVSAASGAKFSDGTTTFWSKGQEAYLESRDKVARNCTNNPQLAIWEHAKLGGVDFRAVGNEPGWYLEIRPEVIYYVGDYGNTRHIVARPEPITDQSARQTMYLARNDKEVLQILIEGTSCIDSMSGETFESTVTVWIDDNNYHGCGRPLH